MLNPRCSVHSKLVISGVTAMRTSHLLLLPLVVLIFFIDSVKAHGAILVTYSDRTAFLAATGATSATGALPNLGLLAGGAAATATVGSVTFSITLPSYELYLGAGGDPTVVNQDWTLRLPGADIAISDVENLNADLAASVFALGFDFAEPENDPNRGVAPFVDSTFLVTLLQGLIPVGTFTFNEPNDSAAFVGVWSDMSFDRVEIRESVGGTENEFFGQFYTSTRALGAVPEPTTCLIWGMLGLLGASYSYSKSRMWNVRIARRSSVAKANCCASQLV
jgi:hypothetical protein